MKAIAKLTLVIGLWTVLALASAMPFGPASTRYRIAHHSDATPVNTNPVGATPVNTTPVGATSVNTTPVNTNPVNTNQADAPVSLTFDKSATSDGVWFGTVAGDVEGRLVSMLIAADQSDPVWMVDLYWVILADDPSQSFVIRTSGTLDSTTGDVVTSGTVVSGYQAGADVEERGRMLDAATSHFTGTIDVLVASAQRLTPTRQIAGLRVD